MRKLLETFLFFPIKINNKKLKSHLRGKTVLITGASSGIGEELVYQLSDVDCQLILVARRGKKLKEMKNKIQNESTKIKVFQADLRKEEDLEHFLSFLHNLPNGLDIIINNAGHSIKRSIYDSLDRYHDFTRTMSINYFAPVQLLLSTIPLLKRNQGQIINISTINSLIAPVPFFSAYQASKSAFDVWLRSIASEIEKDGIHTSSIYFPLVKTPMIQPTKAYRSLPAMTVRQAANIICKSMYQKKKMYKPWWLIFVQLVSIFLRNSPDFTSKGGNKK